MAVDMHVINQTRRANRLAVAAARLGYTADDILRDADKRTILVRGLCLKHEPSDTTWGMTVILLGGDVR